MTASVTDAHVHVGQFDDAYHAPRALMEDMRRAGVAHIFVSSTTICRGDASAIDDVLAEMSELEALQDEEGMPRVHAVLRITPLLAQTGRLKAVVEGRPWAMLKLHPLDPGWECHPHLGEWGAEAAAELGVPVLIHTGNLGDCLPSRHEPLFKAFPQVRFILAHGRPLAQTVEMLERYPNTLVGTAFMPPGDVAELCARGYAGRVLFGTDYPINAHYAGLERGYKYVANCLETLRQALSPSDFISVTGSNAMRVFSSMY